MWLYNLGIFLLGIAIKLMALVKPKAALWVKGRQNWQHQLTIQLKPHLEKSRIWVHCASLGEFEQGRPVLALLREKYPNACLVLSFFSPSGYEIQKHYTGVDVICYMPLDTAQQAQQFIKLLNPAMALFVRYEFWLNHLKILKQNAVPTYLISAVFRPYQPFFKWYGSIFRDALQAYTTIFVQDDSSAQLLHQLNYKRYKICGDTRIDRVIAMSSENQKDLTFLETFKGHNTLFIAGSTWEGDELLVIEAFKTCRKTLAHLKLMIAPHEVEDKKTVRLLKRLKASGLVYVRFSDHPTPEQLKRADVLVLNTIGYLGASYRLAEVVYIGGGFNGGIHSILEPIAFLKPVYFGSTYQKFNEAVQLLSCGGSKSVKNTQELSEALNQVLSQKPVYDQMMAGIQLFLRQNNGASFKITEALQPLNG